MTADLDRLVRESANTIAPDPEGGLEKVVALGARRRRRRRFLVAALPLLLALAATAWGVWPGPDEGDGHHRTGPIRILRSGTVDGQRWFFTIHESTAGLCSEVRLGEVRDLGNAAGGCGYPNDPVPVLTVGLSSMAIREGSGDSLSFVTGTVRLDVARVRIEFPGGETAETSVLGKEEGYEFGFYVFVVPKSIHSGGLTVIALDAGRNELGREKTELIP